MQLSNFAALIVFCLLFTSSLHAQTTPSKCCCYDLPSLKPNQHHWYADLGVGWTFNAKNYDVYVNQPNNNPDIYLPNGKNGDLFLALSAGYNWFFQQNWIPAASIGIEYTYLSGLNNKGQIMQFSSPEFINYNYSYKTENNGLSLLGKLNIYRCGQFMPFLLAGIGTSWNDTKSYQEQALPGVNPRIPPGFSNNSKNTWKYTLGIGLDYQPTQNFLIGLAYRYDDFSKGESGNGLLNFSNTKLNNKTYANTLMLDARYLFA